MKPYYITLLIVCPLVFLAGFIDSIAGGGGLISLPAYLFAGLPSHVAAGTNKFAMSFGTCSSMIRFIRSGNVRLKPALFAGGASLLGSLIGTRLALFLSEQNLRYLMVAVLPCAAIFIAVQKNFGKETHTEKNYSAAKTLFLAALIGLFIGCYDGLIGPGTGTFLILAFTGVLGYNLLLSSGCAKVANFCSNIASLVVYLLNGKILFSVALPAMVCAVLGNQLGARMAIRGGTRVVRAIIFVVLGLLFVKTLHGILS